MSTNGVMSYPSPFLKARVRCLDVEPWILGMCVGYESGKWRDTQLAEHAMEWLPEFALKYNELINLGHNNSVKLTRKAARSIYKTEKFEKRGEFGELFLHIILRQEYKTIPAICKIHYKDSRNDTVKGFDCVHVVATNDSLELWIGEVKFYNDIDRAIRDVIKELKIHTENDYLRDEFTAITNKIDDSWPYSERLKLLLNENVSLDEIFDNICIPVFLTYDSNVIASHDKVNDGFKLAFQKEIQNNWDKFKLKDLPDKIKINLILMPLLSKRTLQEKLHEELKRWN
ncbi:MULTISPECIES: DUF1837 domain-containing protein [Photorhabdus]|nr:MULTISPECIES: DUF1837 domain-containing protein [Photorhabdus]MCC8386333.1 DUF1837 domain-containing protein [Photorhabdus laumondii]MCC8390650.1 DUF1837 domain-containing protein [Photorhabdus laumondii]MCC8415752.1 DUF1837 domain-containing protein [Photorhabdus laumondii]